MRSYDSTTAAPAPSRTGRVVGGVARGTGGMLLLFARLVLTVTALVVLLIAVAIVLRVVGANGGNTVVKGIHDGAKWLVGPFDGMFKLDHHAKGTLALNWGIAAIVYLFAGSIVAGLLRRPAIGALAAPAGADVAATTPARRSARWRRRHAGPRAV